MTDFKYGAELEAAEAVARKAGAAVMDLFKGKFDVHEKSKNNPVTTADLEANRIIRETISQSFPGDGWLSEEDQDSARRLACSRVWVVDPIDGTREFIEGIPQFAISIAFVVDGIPKVSVVFNPAKQRFYKAAAGQGASLNDEAIRVTPRNEIDGAVLLVSRSEPQKKFQPFVDRCEIRPVGSIAYRLAKVAGGDGDATITFRTIHEWDICAGVLMVLEAGGKVVDGAGTAMTFNRQLPKHRGVIAANGALSGGLQGMWARAMGDS
ncbi:MAG TPA: 3'(2'),5'-bisphosphate nucleotidase CysQ [Candidatus Binatia bacterium]|nr:3'(2'),5'-bisphosphate nucleotidase CysQ [Candidatus Binatia bacterium]